jgi:hypothetical protein
MQNYYRNTNFPLIDLSDEEAVAKHVLSQIPRHKQIVLATVQDDGSPWAVSLNWRSDKQLNFVWKSRIDAVHSANIRRDGRAAICITSETESEGEFGFYCIGMAHEVNEDDELRELFAIRYGDGKSRVRAHEQSEERQNSVNDLRGSADHRLYYFEIKQAWLNENQHTKQSVNLDILRSLAND